MSLKKKRFDCFVFALLTSHVRLFGVYLCVSLSTVWMDVEEEYSTMVSTQKVLQDWKAQYAGSYQEAYIALSVPGILAPYVKYELIAWMPFTPEGCQLAAMEWYNALFSYGMTDDTPSDDPDLVLVPKMIEKVVLPAVLHAINFNWQPLSSVQQASALQLVDDLIAHLEGTHSKQVNNLLSAVAAAFRHRSAEETFPPPAHPVQS